MFGRCQCIHNHIKLPDADPEDRWDEELEEGDTNLEEELTIHAMHHANDLAAKANADKPKRTFEEMVLNHYHSFRDLVSKETFDKLPE